MPFCLRAAVSVGLSVAIACLTLSSTSYGVQVWSGLTFNFAHPANSTTQDEITPNVWLTRASLNGIYNASSETGYEYDYSPEWTKWATEINNSEAEVAATNWAELNFVDWRAAYGGQFNLAGNILGTNAVLYLVVDEVYLDIQFTNWGIGGGGAFSYLRAEPPATEATGDYNGNHVVDAADYTIWRDTLGSMTDLRANGDDTGLSAGTIDTADYNFWKTHFGNMVPMGAGGQSAAVPEPSTILLLVGGLLMLAIFRKFSPRGPGQAFLKPMCVEVV